MKSKTYLTQLTLNLGMSKLIDIKYAVHYIMYVKQVRIYLTDRGQCATLLLELGARDGLAENPARSNPVLLRL